MSGSSCERCGRGLYFAARSAGNRWCQPCAAMLGIEMLGDPAAESLRARAARLPRWWAWTVYLGHALLWSDQ